MTENKGINNNLVSLKSRPKEELQEMQRKSVETRRKNKAHRETMAAIYGGFLADKFEISVDGKKKKITGSQYCDMIIKQILKRGDNVTVALLKEMREAMQGNTHNIEVNINKAIATAPEDRAREYRKLMGYTDDEIDIEYSIKDAEE